jgi:signal transduction histidine kinase
MIIAAGRARVTLQGEGRVRDSPCKVTTDSLRGPMLRGMIGPMPLTWERPAVREIAIAVGERARGVLQWCVKFNDSKIDAPAAAVPVFVLVTIPLLWRRSAPLLAATATLVALLIHIVAFGTLTRCGVAFPVAFLLAYTAGAQIERRESLTVLAVVLGGVVAMMSSDSSVDLVALPFFGPLTAGVWGIGRLVRARQTMVDELQVQTAELRRARDERARLEVATDRADISQQLDTLLHRRLGELAKLADAGIDEEPAATARRLEEIEHASRSTLQEMRSVVGVLRDDSDDVAEPQPTLTHLEALLMRAKGADARLEVQGSPRALPAGVELSAYRIVEHLLDALDDAPDVEVRVSFQDQALEIAVAGPARRRGDAGAAIERARERVALHRGTLEARTRAGRSEAVAQLPMLAGV